MYDLLTCEICELQTACPKAEYAEIIEILDDECDMLEEKDQHCPDCINYKRTNFHNRNEPPEYKCKYLLNSIGCRKYET